jgi:hypothetical protein
MKLRSAISGVFLAALASTTFVVPAAAATESPTRADQNCGGGLSARIGVWEEQQSRSSVLGWNDVATVAYGVTLHPGANAFIAAEAKGYDAMGTQTWYGLGTSDTHLRREVPWGEVVAYPAIRILNNGPALAPPVAWTC